MPLRIDWYKHNTSLNLCYSSHVKLIRIRSLKSQQGRQVQNFKLVLFLSTHLKTYIPTRIHEASLPFFLFFHKIEKRSGMEYGDTAVIKISPLLHFVRPTFYLIYSVIEGPIYLCVLKYRWSLIFNFYLIKIKSRFLSFYVKHYY